LERQAGASRSAVAASPVVGNAALPPSRPKSSSRAVPREEVTCRITWLGRPRIERLGCAPDGSLGGRADRHRSRSHQRNWGAKSRDERSWREKCSAHVKSSIGANGCANSSNRQSESPPSLSWFCRIGTAGGDEIGAPTHLEARSDGRPTIGPSRSAISGVMKGS